MMLDSVSDASFAPSGAHNHVCVISTVDGRSRVDQGD